MYTFLFSKRALVVLILGSAVLGLLLFVGGLLLGLQLRLSDRAAPAAPPGASQPEAPADLAPASSDLSGSQDETATGEP